MKSLLIQGLVLVLLLLQFLPVEFRMGEGPLLLASGTNLGISHPPGYPIYGHLLKLTTLLPFGNIAYRGNLCSLFLVLLVFFLFQPVFRYFSGRFHCLGFYFLLLMPTFLDSALKTEVYALNMVFLGLAMQLWLRWYHSTDFRVFVFLSFLVGLSFAHHLTLVMVLPVLIVSMLAGVRVPRQLLCIPVLAFLLGLSVWLYLPVRAGGYPLINWGDPAHYKNFFHLVTAHDEVVPSLLDTFRKLTWPEIMSRLKSLIGQEVHLIFLLMGTYGAFRCYKRDKFKTGVLVTIVLLLLVSTLIYYSHESHSFFLPAFAILCIWMTAGLSCFVEDAQHFLERVNSRMKGRIFIPGNPAIASLLFVIALCFLYISVQLPSLKAFAKGVDSFDQTFFGRGLILTGGENATIMTDHSNLYFGLVYQQLCESSGLDRQVIFRHLLSFPWYLLGQYRGELPVAESFDIHQHITNSEIWNDSISVAIILTTHKSGEVFLVEPILFRKYSSTYFQHMKLVPEGFCFRIGTEKDCSDLRLTPYYKWFVHYSLSSSLASANRNLYYHQHVQQYKGYRQLGCDILAQQEAHWRHLINIE